MLIGKIRFRDRNWSAGLDGISGPVAPRLGSPCQGWWAGVMAGWGAIALVATSATSATSAETLSVTYGSIQAQVPVEEVELFAQTGQLTGELAQYGGLFPAAQRERFRAILQRTVPLDATLVSQLVYSPTGEIILDRLGQIIQEPNGNGAAALGAGLVQAAASPEGLNLVSLLRQFPAPAVQLNGEVAVAMAEAVGQRLQERDRWVSAVEAQAAQAAQTQPLPPDATAQLTQPGKYTWQRLSFNWVDSSRPGESGSPLGRAVPTDLYLPQPGNAQAAANQPVPLVLLSHGVASNRQILAYLAEHLASHGIVVAVPEHVGSNGSKFQRYFEGVAEPPTPREALDRPQDLSFILDQLTALQLADARIPDRLQVDRAVAIGQSFGGYTALALGGAELNLATLRQACQGGKPEDLLNLSLLLQCRLGELDNSIPALKDERVAAVLAVNPFTSRVFNPAGLGAMQVPLMVVAGGADFVVPAVEEQLAPFAGLTGANRYLALLRNGTHFSVLGEPAPEDKALPIAASVVGPHGDVAREYLEALSLAFVLRHGLGDRSYDAYLTPAYGQALSRPEMPLSVVQSLNQPE